MHSKELNAISKLGPEEVRVRKEYLEIQFNILKRIMKEKRRELFLLEKREYQLDIERNESLGSAFFIGAATVKPLRTRDSKNKKVLANAKKNVSDEKLGLSVQQHLNSNLLQAKGNIKPEPTKERSIVVNGKSFQKVKVKHHPHHTVKTKKHDSSFGVAININEDPLTYQNNIHSTTNNNNININEQCPTLLASSKKKVNFKQGSIKKSISPSSIDQKKKSYQSKELDEILKQFYSASEQDESQLIPSNSANLQSTKIFKEQERQKLKLEKERKRHQLQIQKDLKKDIIRQMKKIKKKDQVFKNYEKKKSQINQYEHLQKSEKLSKIKAIRSEVKNDGEIKITEFKPIAIPKKSYKEVGGEEPLDSLNNSDQQLPQHLVHLIKNKQKLKKFYSNHKEESNYSDLHGIIKNFSKLVRQSMIDFRKNNVPQIHFSGLNTNL